MNSQSVCPNFQSSSYYTSRPWSFFMSGPCVHLLIRCFLWWEEWGSQATRDQEDENFACFLRPLSHHHFVWRETLPCFKRLGRSQMAKLQQEVGSTRFTISLPTNSAFFTWKIRCTLLKVSAPSTKSTIEKWCQDRIPHNTGSWKFLSSVRKCGVWTDFHFEWHVYGCRLLRVTM